MPSLPLSVDLHGLTLTFQTPEPTLYQRFETVYGHLPVTSQKIGVNRNVDCNLHSYPRNIEKTHLPPQKTETSDTIYIHWTLHPEVMAPFPPPNVSAISEDNLVNYYSSGQLIYIRMPKYGLITVDLEQRQLTGIVTQNCLDVYGAFEDVMMISLAPLYRRRGWFPLHAFAALDPYGRAALITGAMGAGKTTTGLSLLNAGWKLLSNDSPLLHLRDSKIEVLAYPGQLSAFEDSLSWFTKLQHFVDAKGAPQKGRDKRVFRAEDAFDDPWAEQGTAGGVFFPQVVPELERSMLVDVSPSEAVLQLMPQAIEGWDKAAIGQSLALLSKLVEQVPCYHLKLSPHVDQLPSLIEQGLNG